ncbi:MAG: GspE/PulE family protein [Planctomycetota bacterium]
MSSASNGKPESGPGSPGNGAPRPSAAAEVFAPLGVTADHAARFAHTQGADDEPWDVLLTATATDEHAGLTAIAERYGLEYEEEPSLEDSAEVFYEHVPAGLARRHHIAGLSLNKESGVLRVATATPLQPAVFSALERLVDLPIELVLVPRAAVGNIINRGYEQRQDLVTEIVEDIPFDESAFEQASSSLEGATDLLSLARQGPVIRLVNMILFEALRRKASDVHIHPLESKLLIRFRVDGMLVDAYSPPLSLAPAISSRLKVMAELDIANRHAPQDGQAVVRIGSRKIDIRMSCIPTIFGERLVLRLLDQNATKLDLDALGMSARIKEPFLELVERPNGIILVTGPTGSGKTTTLYAALEQIDRMQRNVMTIEDPVEYHVDGVAQMQVNVKRGVTFAAGLRSLLRQDPDVILVGEIRDQETAQLAVQASLTGHLVLATLHTNDAPSAISRLQDIGIEAYLISSSLLAVLAQRLVRKLVSGTEGDPHGPRFAGRLAIHELMLMDDALRDAATRTGDAVALKKLAIERGMQPMIVDGSDKVVSGMTTELELRRVLAVE